MFKNKIQSLMSWGQNAFKDRLRKHLCAEQVADTG